MKSLISILKQDYLILLSIVLAGALIRLDFLIDSNFQIDSDEAIVGLMAKHIMEGGDWPTFYYGQHYMGSFESLLVAALSYFTGLGHVSLKLIPFFFALIFIVLVYLITYELSNKVAARFAAAFAAISPIAFIIWSTKARGGFIEIIVIGALSFLILIRAIKYREVNYRCLYYIAFLLGLGWWVNNQIAYFMIPVFIILLFYCLRNIKFTKSIQYLLFSVLVFCLGSLPYWVYNFTNDFASFGIVAAANDGDFEQYSASFFNVSLPIILGARKFWTFTDNFPDANLISFVFYSVLLCILLLVRWKSILNFFILKLDLESPQEILILLAISVFLIFTNSGYGHLAEAPRYLLPIYLSLFCLSAIAISKIFHFSKITGTVLFLAVIIFNLVSCYYPKRQHIGEHIVFQRERVSKDNTELVSWLNQNSFKWVRTNYWIGYRLAFETEEQIRFLMFSKPPRVRIDDYQIQGKEFRDSAPFVLVPSQAVLIRKALEVKGYTYKETKASDYVIIYDYHPSQENLQIVDNNLIDVVVYDNQELKQNILDNDVDTRWGSGRPQSPDMKVEFNFKEPISIRGFSYDIGKWYHDYPRRLAIFAIDSEGNYHELLNQSEYRHLRYMHASDSINNFYFPAIEVKQVVFQQLGSDPIFDWSIASIDFFR